MKRIFALIIVAFTLCLTLFLASCDYQESVDSARADLMDSAKELLDPFLNQTKPSNTANSASSDIDKGNSAASSLQESNDVKADK